MLVDIPVVSVVSTPKSQFFGKENKCSESTLKDGVNIPSDWFMGLKWAKYTGAS